ncbi:MAG: YcxB family protein [Prevotellaceae bacterium]|jgi:hypothetical protein|nr:YcxB family protein [Prevotellaceae bacterium]
MKKFNGIIVICICSFFLLLLLFGAGIMIFEGINNTDTKELIYLTFAMLVCVSLCILGLIDGIKCLQKEKPPIIIEYDKSLNINILGQISLSKYRKMNLELLQNKKSLSLYFLIAAFVLFIGAAAFQSPIYAIVPLLMLLYCFSIFYRARNNNSNNNKIFQEQLQIKITNDEFCINGETFNSTILWSKYVKLKETKSFFLLYQDNIVVNLVQKDWLSEIELTEFRNFLYSLDIPKELYKIK